MPVGAQVEAVVVVAGIARGGSEVAVVAVRPRHVVLVVPHHGVRARLVPAPRGGVAVGVVGRAPAGVHVVAEHEHAPRQGVQNLCGQFGFIPAARGDVRCPGEDHDAARVEYLDEELSRARGAVLVGHRDLRGVVPGSGIHVAPGDRIGLGARGARIRPAVTPSDRVRPRVVGRARIVERRPQAQRGPGQRRLIGPGVHCRREVADGHRRGRWAAARPLRICDGQGDRVATGRIRARDPRRCGGGAVAQVPRVRQRVVVVRVPGLTAVQGHRAFRVVRAARVGDGRLVR